MPTNRRTLDNLIALMIPEIQELFIQVMQDIADEAILADVVEAIERNDPEAAFKAIGFTPAALSPLLDAIERVYKDAGVITADGFPARIRTPIGRVAFGFDMRNPTAEFELRTHSSEFITRITDETKANVRTTLERGLLAGNNPRTTALEIVGRVDPVTRKRTGGVIGLTANQESWVANTRRDLEQLSKGYFTRDLRDKRFDSIVLKAIESGKPLSKVDIDRLITSYKNRALKYRADAISRTETIQGLNRGEWRSYMQAIEEGTLHRNAMRKYWDSSGDSRVRHTHRVLDKKYEKGGLAIDEPFISPSGAKLLFPGDTSLGAPADEIIHCRCRWRIVVDWFLNEELLNGTV